jgi:hypothetical protein
MSYAILVEKFHGTRQSLEFVPQRGFGLVYKVILDLIVEELLQVA